MPVLQIMQLVRIQRFIALLLIHSFLPKPIGQKHVLLDCQFEDAPDVLGVDNSQSLEGKDMPDVQHGLVGGLPADCLGFIEENQRCNSVFMASVEGLAIEGGVVDDYQFANKV